MIRAGCLRPGTSAPALRCCCCRRRHAPGRRVSWVSPKIEEVRLMRHWIPVVLVFVGCGGGGAKSPTGGGGAGGTGGPAIGPGPGVTGGGQVGGGTQGGTGPAVTATGASSYWLQNTSLKVQPSTAPGTM